MVQPGASLLSLFYELLYERFAFRSAVTLVGSLLSRSAKNRKNGFAAHSRKVAAFGTFN